MDRTGRIAILAALGLVVALAGTTMATRSPAADAPGPQLADDHDDGAPDDTAVQRVADRLGVDAGRVRKLADQHGFGTAVRLLAWEQAGVDVTVEDLLDRRANGDGWGVIAKELGVHPGLGSIMGNGGGQGRDTAPGQQRGDEDD